MLSIAAISAFQAVSFLIVFFFFYVFAFPVFFFFHEIVALAEKRCLRRLGVLLGRTKDK